jgi:hypothetical protein
MGARLVQKPVRRQSEVAAWRELPTSGPEDRNDTSPTSRRRALDVLAAPPSRQVLWVDDLAVWSDVLPPGGTNQEPSTTNVNPPRRRSTPALAFRVVQLLLYVARTWLAPGARQSVRASEPSDEDGPKRGLGSSARLRPRGSDLRSDHKVQCVLGLLGESGQRRAAEPCGKKIVDHAGQRVLL